MRFSIILFGFFVSTAVSSAELKVATSSNFAPTMRALTAEFERQTGNSVIMISGSTGKHYAQIRAGAPFDVFLAADTARPRLLEQQGHTVFGTRQTYAVGQLVLWSRKPFVTDSDPVSIQALISAGVLNRFAIANPTHAPYGIAAREVLMNLDVWNTAQNNLVRGENVGQAFHFVVSGNAELGLVAASQYQQYNEGVSIPVPKHLYSPIEQQVVLLRDSAVGREFLRFLTSPRGLQIISENGYDLPLTQP